MRNFICIALLTFAVASCAQAPSPAELAAERSYQEFIARNHARSGLLDRLSNGDRARYESEMVRIEGARRWELPDTATYDRIMFIEGESTRIMRAQQYHLPLTATWGDIMVIENRRARARDLGLPEDAPEAQVDQAYQAYSRAQAARDHAEYMASLGLPSTATDEEVEAARTAKWRRQLATDIGLPETATEAQINQRLRETAPTAQERAANARHLAEIHAAERRRAADERALLRREALNRGLPATATRDDIEAWEVERVRRQTAAFLNLPETAGWGDIYDKTQNPPPPDTYVYM